MDLTTLIQNNLALLQKYLLANDQQHFLLNDLALPQEKKLFEYLLHPLQENQKELIASLNLDEQHRQLLLYSKAYRELDHTEDQEQRQKLITKIKEMLPSLWFDYPKPAEVSSQTKNIEPGQEIQKKPIAKFQTEATVQEVVSRALKQDPSNFSKLSIYGIKNIPLSRLAEIKEQSQLQFLFSKPEIIRSLDPEAIAELFSRMIDRAVEKKQTSVEQQFPTEFFTTLSFEQLQALKRIKGKLFEGYEYHLQLFRLKYEEKFNMFKPIATLTFDELTQKKQLCKEALKQLKQSGKDFYGNLIEKLTEEILLIDEAKVNSDQQLLVEYLRNLKSFQYENLDSKFKTEKRQVWGRNKYANKSFPTLGFLQSSRVSQSTIINGTIVSLFKNQNEGTIDALSPYLNRKFLVKQYAKVLLSKGQQKKITNIHDIFTSDQLNNLKQRREITFLPSNKQYFSAKDRVQLKVRIKNVKKLTKKIYTINLEKQLLQSRSDIDEQINLKFLVPQIQQLILTKQDSDAFEQIIYPISFKELDGKLGEFIIQLQGEGISSRAIIRRGKIILQNKPTPIGHQLTFFDGEGQPIQNLVIWRDGKRIQVNEKYFIPYGPQGSEAIIAVSNGYAQQLYINILNEQFKFSCDYLYHSESFIVGNKARIILHPSLKLNEEATSLARIDKCSITVTSINNQGIASTQVTQNVIFKDNEDFLVEYPVKAYVKALRLDVRGEIELINKEKTPISHSGAVIIDLQEGNENFVDLYLTQDYSGDYTLKIRGKNGESIPNAGAVLSYQQFGINFSFSKDLTADQNGEISLGRLQQVVKLTVQVTHNTFNSVRTWRLNNFSDSVSYGGNIHAYNTYKVLLKEGDNYILPLPCQLDLRSDIIFQQKNATLQVFYNKISDVKLTKHKLILQNLTVGTYTLFLLRLNRRIDIQVIKGKEWIGGKIITEDHVTYKLNNKPQNLLSLGQIKAQAKEEHVQYSIQVISASEHLPSDLRVHIFAKNYIDSQMLNTLNCEARVCCPKPDVQTISYQQSTYYSNKRLSDETAYVLNRKTQDYTNGNNLEKPHIFLKRIEVRATSQKDEQLAGEGQYQKQMMYGDHHMMAKCAMPRGMMMNDCLFGASASNAYLAYPGSKMTTLTRSLNSHNNFLVKVGHLSANLKKIQSIRVPKGYSHISVYLFSGDNAVRRDYALPQGKMESLKLTHSALFDQTNKTGWTMSRQIYQVRQGEKKEISRSSTWTTVALSNVLEYAKIQGISLPQWLTAWRNYSPDKKLQVYDKEACHELNFFIYRNDKDFFEDVVRPFIINKLRKTFIDYYLLDDKEALIKSSKTHSLIKLNYFERALLAQKLKSYGKDKQAESLASSLELPLKGIKKSNEEFKTFFETVLNAKKDQPPPTAQQSILFNAPGFGGALFSAPPPPPMAEEFDFAPQLEMCCDQAPYALERCMDIGMVAEAKESYKPGFKQTEKTKEYTETTYSGLTNPEQSASLVPLSHFWAELARHFVSNNDSAFLSDKFSHLSQKVQFVLACSVFYNEPQADYELSPHQNGYLITAKNSFLVFVRQVKSLPFEQSKNVVLNQRFFDHKNRYRVDEQGAQIQKQVQTFLVQKPYTVQTLLTNISGSNLEIQLLMDIPEGAIPLLSHEQTQIINVSLPAYNTRSFERVFYFPEEGKYHFYPANASKSKAIISKSAPIPPLAVTRTETVGKLETLDNILRSGSDADILSFIATKNIFDQNVFNFGLILWKLKDRDFFNKVIAILKERQLYQHTVWSFSFYHNDFELIRQYLANGPQIGEPLLTLPIFEYYPYYSRRAHKFADENKSTIRVQEFRDNYARFLFNGIFTNSTKHPHYTLTFIYYLLLQDRITEARTLFNAVAENDRKQFKVQYDYIACFLDMYEGASTDYKIAREISQKYKEYPVLSWRKLFSDVYNTLNKTQEEDSEQGTKAEEVAFSTTVVNAGGEIKINRPANVKVILNLYQIDIELYFSQFPFSEIAQFSAIKPTTSVSFQGAEFKVQKLQRNTYSNLKNIFVEIYQQKTNSSQTKISSFFWNNPEVKVKINQREGTLKVFHKGKKCTTSYVKVYSRGGKGQKFARDGYTDVASTFRYALDVKDIQEFSILVLTDFGGSIHKVKPPSIY